MNSLGPRRAVSNRPGRRRPASLAHRGLPFSSRGTSCTSSHIEDSPTRPEGGGAHDTDELSNLFTSNDARARIVLYAVRDKVADFATMKALAFCVSRDHARYMTRVCNGAGSVPRQCSATRHPVTVPQ